MVLLISCANPGEEQAPINSEQTPNPESIVQADKPKAEVQAPMSEETELHASKPEEPALSALSKTAKPEIKNPKAEVAAEKMEVIPDVPAKPTHASWNALVSKYVTADGKVNYKGFKTELAKVEAYLVELSANSPAAEWSKEEKLCFWINLYNAATVKLILTNYPLKSITDIEKPWDKKFVSVGTKTYTLNEIENTVVRPQFKEPLIHFGLNCAAKSCPKLLNAAYTPNKLMSQLTNQAKLFLGNTSKNQLSASAAKISKIFEWYKEDFVAKGTLIDFLNQYSSVKIQGSAKVSYLDYDWSLNE